MQAKELYEVRLEMAKMHDDVLLRIDKAIKNKHSIEACWLCYSCFESRINRTLEKVSELCKDRRCIENPKVGISTKIDCLKRLRKAGYIGIEKISSNTLGQARAWCSERNSLVHNLMTLNNYYGMDEKFLDLAKRGKPLVEKLYKETTDFRNTYYELDEMPPFPEDVRKKCRPLQQQEKREKNKSKD